MRYQENKKCERTMQWRRSCSSGNYQRWQSRNQTRRIGNHRPARTPRGLRILRRRRRPYRRWPVWISHQSWTLCTCALSSTSSPWMSSCTHRPPTFPLLPETKNNPNTESWIWSQTWMARLEALKGNLNHKTTILKAIAIVAEIFLFLSCYYNWSLVCKW